MSFESAYTFTARFEGGYAKNPADPGGETFRGISRVAWPDWPGWPVIDRIKKALDDRHGFLPWDRVSSWKKIDKEALNYQELFGLVKDFYLTNIYKPVKAWNLPEDVTDKLFDLNVNLSPSSAGKVFQRALNDVSSPPLTVDGAVGPLTLARARAQAPTELLRAIAKEQERFYEANTIPKFPAAESSFRARARGIPVITH
jgi:lysozyme family protein